MAFRPRGLLARLGLLAGILADTARKAVNRGGYAVGVKTAPMQVPTQPGHGHFTSSAYTKPSIDRQKRNKRNRIARKSRAINMKNGSYRRATA